MSKSTLFHSCLGVSWVEPALSWRIKYTVLGNNTVPLVRLEPATSRFQVKHSNTGQMHSSSITPKGKGINGSVQVRLQNPKNQPNYKLIYCEFEGGMGKR